MTSRAGLGQDTVNFLYKNTIGTVYSYDAYSYRERGLARVIVRGEADRGGVVAGQGRRCRQAGGVKIYS